jgi:predicted nucleotide-binding protein
MTSLVPPMTPPVIDQEFVAHLFLFEEGPLADEAYAVLCRIWQACRQQLGTTAPIAGLPSFQELPPRQDLLGGDVLAALERPGARDRQCVLRRVGKVLNLSVMMEQYRPERSGLRRLPGNDTVPVLGWREFSQLWSRVSGNVNELLLGESVLLLARTQTKRRRWAGATPQLAESLVDLLPYQEKRRRGWWRHGTTSPQGFATWDTGLGRDAAARELVIVAPSNTDQELSRWVWSDDGSAHLPAFAEYLLHASLLRYQAEVLENWHVSPAGPDVTELVRDLLGADEAAAGSQAPVLQSHLRRLQRNELDLDTLVERLQQVIDTATDSLGQMGETWGGDQNSVSILAADLEVAVSLVKQAERERNTQRSRLTRTRNARQLVTDDLSRPPPAVEDQTRGPRARSPISTGSDVSRNVFVVHGRDKEARRAIFSILQALGLRPMDWELLVNATGTTTPTIMETVRTAPGIAQATVVLMTPDDIVQLHPDLAGKRDPKQETDLSCQPRPNVLVELGMALMVAPERTIILEFGSLRPISDLAGLHAIRFDGSPRSVLKLAERLEQAGCPVDTSDSHLLDDGRFTGLGAIIRQPHDPTP